MAGIWIDVDMGIAAVLAENERLRALVAEREAELARQKAELAALQASNDDLARRLELQRLKLVGPRQERHVDGEARLTLPLALVTPHPPHPPPRLPERDDGVDEAAKPEKKRGVQRRRLLAERTDLPTRRVKATVDPDAACGTCGQPVKVVGARSSWRIDWVPGHFERVEVVREQCACPSCPGEGVLIAPEPSFALRKSLCGNGLLARVLVDKFADHIPLNRLAARMEREGETFTTATLSGWVVEGAKLLRNVADAIDARLMASSWLQGDDTGFPVQDGTDGQLRKGRLWAVTDQKEVRYHFTDTKGGKHPAAFLDGFRGKLLLVDGGSEFNEVVREKGLLRAGCWSHLRRYFFDARHHHPVEARLALGTLRDLFELEASVRDASPEHVREVRHRDARPLVDGFFAWVTGLHATARPSSSLGEAVTYALNGQETFVRFLDHPELPMHNNVSERKLRQPVVGRKNWLFARTEGGAQAAATVYTIVGSCMLQGIDPWEYLVDVLDRLPDHPATRKHELTPLNWRRARDGLPALVP